MRDAKTTPTDPTSLTARSANPQGGTSAVRAGDAETTIPSIWRFLVPVILVLLVVLVFMPALDAGFVDWDDDDLLIHNIRHRTFSVESVRWMFTTSFSGHFQPLTWMTFTLDWMLWKREMFGYHLTNCAS